MRREAGSRRRRPQGGSPREHLEETSGRAFHARALTERLPDLDLATIAHSLRTLTPTYLDIRDGQGIRRDADLMVIDLTELGRRAAGLWPAEDSHTEALVAAILAAAEQVDDEDERGRLRKAADALAKGTGRVLEGAIAAVIAGAVGGNL